MIERSVRLNVGAGRTKIEGFEPIDRKLGGEAFPLKRNDGTSVGDDSVDEIRASHVLEHLSFGDARQAVVEWLRALRPGGSLRIAVPDFDKVAVLPEDDPKRLRYLMGGQSHDDDFHRSAFTEGSLRGLLKWAGGDRVERWSSDNTDCAALPISLNLECRKAGDWSPPPPDDEIDVKIAAVTSIPRLGFNDHWGCIVDALRPFRIPLHRFTGAFWGQCFQRVLEGAVQKGADWILTLDYDTLFTAQDLDRMFGHFGSHPEIDALAALQCRRRHDTPLLTIGRQTEAEVVEGVPFKVDTAHFGLTLIRAECLQKLPRPWFMGIPNLYGRWDDERSETDVEAPGMYELRKIAGFGNVPDVLKIDPDIYFWKKWQHHGFNVHVAADARVGHIEEMASVFDEKLNLSHVHVNDWMNDREPVSCASS